MVQSARPPFTPLPYLPSEPWDSLAFAAAETKSEWVPVCSCPAGFPVETFDAAVSQMVHHPEYNSTLILRSEIIEESEQTLEHEVPELQGLRFVRNIRRRLLPRRPGRDPPIEQNCTFYAISSRTSCNDVDNSVQVDTAEGGSEAPIDCLVLTPKLDASMQMPYYHPPVFHIAFRYLYSPEPHDGDGSDINGKAVPRLRIEVVLRPESSDPKDINSRIYRTCLSLLDTLHRYGWGILTNYRKQASHDCIVSREEYQDLYLIMRERYKHVVGQWHENTDPLKHVFEDIGIATFLMLLWKQGAYDAPILPSEIRAASTDELIDRMAWHSWPRPRGGFLDFGCGNGFLVHILHSEGYDGEGIDLRARNSWKHYPPETQAHLHVHAVNPLDLPTSTSSSHPVISNPFLKPGVFIIANHADELSPWTPVLATLCGASGFLSIPCCPWSFDARFHRVQMPFRNTSASEGEAAFTFTLPEAGGPDDFIESLRLGGMGGDAGKSSYAAYRVWLACLGVRCGWNAESETLRIPSTRNWALVGRRRCGNEAEAIENALHIIQQVRGRGLFKTRRPEGKGADH